MFKNTWINQKGKIDQKKNDKHAKHKYEKVYNKKEMDKQFFWICGSSLNLFSKEVMDRENKRRKKKTHVIETRKHDEKKDNRWTNVWAKKDIKR